MQSKLDRIADLDQKYIKLKPHLIENINRHSSWATSDPDASSFEKMPVRFVYCIQKIIETQDHSVVDNINQ